MHKIMLVEDDATMLSLLSTLLQLEGFQVVKVKQDSLEGILNEMRLEKPSLALIDVYLRAASGFDILRKLRQDPELTNIHVLMSSGMDFREQCLQRGADDFIMKPYMPDELIKKMHFSLGDKSCDEGLDK